MAKVKKWKELWTSESDNGNWEILNHIDKKEITLHYVPEEDYSENDIKIKMSYEKFNDLSDFIIDLNEIIII
jgi:hypothetical protein